MSTLGSIFSDQELAEGGIPLYCEVRVPSRALGMPEGVWVEVPLHFEGHEGPVARVLAHPPDGAWIPLRLPAGMPDGTRLRLRGQGGRDDAGRVGPLVLRIVLDEQAPLYQRPGHALVAAGSSSRNSVLYVIAAILLGLFLLRGGC